MRKRIVPAYAHNERNAKLQECKNNPDELKDTTESHRCRTRGQMIDEKMDKPFYRFIDLPDTTWLPNHTTLPIRW
jgi:hypothetical protein